MKNSSFYLTMLITVVFFFITHSSLYAQQQEVALLFTVAMPHPEMQRHHVIFKCEGIKKDSVEFKMPAWMPGYYQIHNRKAIVKVSGNKINAKVFNDLSISSKKGVL